MKQYFTALQLKDGKYIGTVYDPYTNAPVYVTQAYDEQIDANIDIAEHIKNLNAPSTESIDPNRPHPLPRQMYPRRCCGQR